MFISAQSYEALKITIHGFSGAVKFLLNKNIGSIKAKKFNQDKLEQYFGLLRMAGGARTNPTAMEVVEKTISLHVQGKAAQPSSKGNTTRTSKVQVDESPLDCRKKP